MNAQSREEKIEARLAAERDIRARLGPAGAGGQRTESSGLL